ncbi:hypothetical protein CCAX7_55640 [Capsulimonas corticalis]|uniref:Uncharacterized protein n=1 Tax=Capsulimonas corticalis TaxID=2219043 RepID=A0A402D0R2_9BACT|nr:hypothetical protein [Capsulimonas corticalis]BDI33513.1 hypothetical protein CCAX7_55640 [Capsulimonas corticalis]
MLRFLGTLDPPIAKFPHCLMRSTRGNLETALAHVADTPLWYGAGPLWSYLDRAPDLLADLNRRYPDEDALDDFLATPEASRLWLLPEMQEILKDNIGRYDDNFSFAYPASTPPQILQRVPLKSHTVYHPNGEIHYYSYPSKELYMTESAPKWIEEIGWAYIPFGCEVNYAIFVTGHRMLGANDAVKEALLRQGERVAVLEQGAGRFDWRWL